MNKVYLVYGNHNGENKSRYKLFYDGHKETTLSLLGRCLTLLKPQNIKMLESPEIKKLKLESGSEFPLLLTKQEDFIKINFKGKAISIPSLTFMAVIQAWLAITKDKPVLVELTPGLICFTYTLNSSKGKTINSCTYCCDAARGKELIK